MNQAVKDRIFAIRHNEVIFPFDGNPFLSIKPRNKKAYGGVETIDPFPCYAHSADLVEETAAKVEALFPMGYMPSYYLLPYETPSRTNGHATRHYISSVEDPAPYEPYIVLSGKRIPLHPAMTRYLVAHEYGHCVNMWIEFKRGLPANGYNEFDREYEAMRGIKSSDHYGGLRWHSSIGEVIANDFRILVCNVEPEFWPHQGIARPEELPQLQQFWGSIVRDFAYRQELPL